MGRFLGAVDWAGRGGPDLLRVLARSEMSVRVRTQSGMVGWMPFHGVLSGACDGVPFMQTRPDPPAGVCAVYLDYTQEAAVLRGEPDHDSEMITPVPAGEWMPVLARARQTAPDSGWYKVRLAGGQEGWLYAGIVLNLGTVGILRRNMCLIEEWPSKPGG